MWHKCKQTFCSFNSQTSPDEIIVDSIYQVDFSALMALNFRNWWYAIAQAFSFQLY